ncbi:hypothetical protein GIB67_026126 [Kingdonia uniflora]|uniref:J domain-containing protein n=1 Tax=Kingdonia uniflora TaxID=39325 RepID=A0A7J7M356_9MAGN|nr:hypothetical protein GIB67_026126 [Kingdonia uniflora]
MVDLKLVACHPLPSTNKNSREKNLIKKKSMSRTICRPNIIFDRLGFSFRNPNYKSSSFPRIIHSSYFGLSGGGGGFLKVDPTYRVHSRVTLVRASKWTQEKSPYDTLELERDANDEKIKFAYRRLAKFYHPDEGFEESEEWGCDDSFGSDDEPTSTMKKLLGFEQVEEGGDGKEMLNFLQFETTGVAEISVSIIGEGFTGSKGLENDGLKLGFP